jgi:hypothetical protein
MKTITKLLPIILIFTLLFFTPISSHAAQCVNRTTGETSDAPITGNCPIGTVRVATISDLEFVFASIISVAGILIGMVFFIMLMVGGLRYLLSGGDPKALLAAKGTITWAIIGLALFTLSFTIILLIQLFTGVNLTVFRIGT